MPQQMAPPAPTGSDFFGDYSPAVTCASAVFLVLAISVIDKLTGQHLHLGVLHLVPIAVLTWALGRTWGVALAILAAGLSVFRGEPWSFHSYWNAALLLVTFGAFVLLIARLREALRAHELSFAVLEKLDSPAYVVDLQRDVVLVGNRAFRDLFEGRAAEELASYPAHESRFALQDGRPALLRILTL